MRYIVRPVVFRGTGCAVPNALVTSEQRDAELGLPAGTVFRSSGVESRYVASCAETASILGARAVCEAMQNSGLMPSDIDCLVVASASMDQALPYNAALIHKELGWNSGGRVTFDVGASCMSFLVALDQVSYPIVAGRFRNVVIVSSDISSCGLDWNVLESSAIFGDGAAAVVVSAAPQTSSTGILSSGFLTLSEGADYCEIPGSGTRNHPTRSMENQLQLNLFRMNGRAVFKLVSQHLPEFVARLCDDAGVVMSDLDWIVPHQASLLAMKHLTVRIGFEKEKVVDIFATRGNQVAASLPTALHVAVTDGRIRSGNLVLLLGTGAGVSIGGMILRV